MLEEYNHALAELCEEAASDVYSAIIGDLTDWFSPRIVPEGGDARWDFLYFLAPRYDGLGRKDLVGDVYFREARQALTERVTELGAPERLALACFFVENADKVPTDEDITDPLLDNWLVCLYDNKLDTERQP